MQACRFVLIIPALPSPAAVFVPQSCPCVVPHMSPRFAPVVLLLFPPQGCLFSWLCACPVPGHAQLHVATSRSLLAGQARGPAEAGQETWWRAGDRPRGYPSVPMFECGRSEGDTHTPRQKERHRKRETKREGRTYADACLLLMLCMSQLTCAREKIHRRGRGRGKQKGGRKGRQ